ncbi:MAG: hypothetical protein ACLTDI_12705 [Acutalibacteraceae bacterium]
MYSVQVQVQVWPPNRLRGDVLQARWGTHGDHSMIVLSPSSVQDCFDLMITAFNYSEQYRTPVIFLSDEIIGHLGNR